MIQFLTVPDPNDPSKEVTAKNISIQHLSKLLLKLHHYGRLVEDNQNRATLSACAAMAREYKGELEMLIERLEVHERKNLVTRTRRTSSSGKPQPEPGND